MRAAIRTENSADRPHRLQNQKAENSDGACRVYLATRGKLTPLAADLGAADKLALTNVLAVANVCA
jgi:hypothetical protein